MPSPLKLCQLLLAFLVISTLHFGRMEGAKILGLFAHSSESNFAVMRSLVLELTRRQHNVTIYSSHRLNERITNLNEIIIEPEFPFWRELEEKAIGSSGDLTKLAALPPAAMQKALTATGEAAVEQFLSHNAVIQLLQRPKSEFDYELIIVDLFYSEALLALGHLHNTPTIAIVSADFENYMQHVQEDIVLTTVTPNSTSLFDRPAAYFKPQKPFAATHHTKQNNLVAKHFYNNNNNVGRAPNVQTLQSELAVVLFNNHVPFVNTQPLLLNTIFAGGMHINAPRELPWNVRRFLDDSRIGVIYMNLGNEQLCGSIPPQRLQVIFDCLGALKEHVLWTCHDVKELQNQPKNFMLQHMVAQTDILAHPHVKIFITNGDIVALQEGIYRHMPMVSIPLFRHEKHNVAIAERLGITVKLDYNNVTVQSLEAAVLQLIEDPTYQHNIRRIAKMYRDRPLGPLETSMYWIEYILRNKGGKLLQTHDIIHYRLDLFYLFFYYLGVISGFVAFPLSVLYWVFNKIQQRKHHKSFLKLN